MSYSELCVDSVFSAYKELVRTEGQAKDHTDEILRCLEFENISNKPGIEYNACDLRIRDV